MPLSTEAVTAGPALVMLAMAGCLAVLSLQISISHIQVALVYMSLAFFFSGLVLAISWFNYWGIRGEFQEEIHDHAA